MNAALLAAAAAAVRRIAAALAAVLAVVLLLAPVSLLAVADPPTASAPAPVPVEEATRQLLEKSLSIVEIDKEIARVAARRSDAEINIRTKELQLTVKEAQIEKRRGDAGRVLRSYYMGERDVLLAAFLSVDNLTDLFAVFDYFDAVFLQDQNTLNAFRKQYRSLQQEHGSLVTERGRLARIEAELRAQRDRVAALHADVNGALGSSGDAERLRLLMEEMNRYWDTAGLMEVNRYFRALADAMGKLPDFVKNNKGMLEINGLTYTLKLPEAELNRFLREQNNMFRAFDFRFGEGSITAHGKEGTMEIEIKGHYTVENNPVNALIFHVDDLVFNGLHLPDTTRRELERKFDLGFYPQKIVPFVRAESVAVGGRELTVNLGVQLQSDK